MDVKCSAGRSSVHLSCLSVVDRRQLAMLDRHEASWPGEEGFFQLIWVVHDARRQQGMGFKKSVVGSRAHNDELSVSCAVTLASMLRSE